MEQNFSDNPAPAPRPLFGSAADAPQPEAKPLFDSPRPEAPQTAEAPQPAPLPENVPAQEFGMNAPSPAQAPQVPQEPQEPVPAPAPFMPQEIPQTFQKKKQKTTLTVNVEESTLGTIICNARINAGLEIAQVSQFTRLRAEYIEALEKDDFSQLPVGSYPAAYIRSLCALYHLDEESMEAISKKLHDNAAKNKVSDKLLQRMEESKRVNLEEEKKVRRIIWIAGCVLLLLFLLIAGIISAAVLKNRSPEKANNPQTVVRSAETKSEDRSKVTRQDLEKLSPPQLPVIRELEIK